MSRLYGTFISRETCLTKEANVLSCNYSNALNTFRGNSVLVSDRFENQQYKQFLKLKDRWKLETRFVSSSTVLFNNSAYKEIIGFGIKSVPWIIRDMKKTDNHWFFALKQITGINPINPENFGIISKMKEDWINWAKQNNY